ncbi:MAG: hypothetical protein GY942_25755, partial [Aestuariibacter sp.]|nr:hypothetical protein [Aestuariibacter sp.]
GATFATSDVNDGTVAGFTYTDFANLTGGTGADTFDLDHDVTGAVNGGDEGDTFNINISLNADLDGGNDADTFNLTDGMTVTSLTGGGGAGSGADDDTLAAVGGGTGNTWTVTTGDGGNIDGQAFTEMENLTGDANVDDIFTFTTGTLTGSIAGGGTGTDTLNVAAPATVTVNLANSSVSTLLNAGAANGFSGIETFIGDNTADTLIGPNVGAIFAISGENDGTVAGFTFTDFANLTGGTGADEFVFTDGAELTGSIDGGADSDTLNLGAYATTLTFTLSAAGTTDGVMGMTAGVPTNPISGSFDNIDDIRGGNGGNSFNVTAALSADLTGGTGSDSLTLTNAAPLPTVTHTFVNANDGSVGLNGDLISYVNFESISDSLTATNRIFTFNGG